MKLPLSVSHPLWRWPLILGLAGLYCVTARLGLLLAFEHTNASPVWPPSGIALAVLLLGGLGLWPGVTLGAWAANILVFWQHQVAPLPLIVAISAVVAVGNTLEAVIGTLLLRRFVRVLVCLERSRDVSVFIGVALLAALVSASIGPTALAVAGVIPWSLHRLTWLIWWMGDAISMLTIGAFLLSWRATEPQPRTWRRWLEAIGVWLAAVVVSQFGFGEWWHPEAARYPIAFLIMPVLVWAALRLGIREVTTTLVLVAGVAVWQTVHGLGMFARPSLHESLLLLDAFLGVLSVTFLFLSASVTERRRMERIVQEARRELQARINELDRDGVSASTKDVQIGALHEAIKWHTHELAKRAEELQVQRVAALNIAQDAEEARRKLERAQMGLQRLAAIIESSDDAIIGLTLDGRIDSWNPAAERMFGYTASDVRGRPITMLAPADQPDALPEIVGRVKRGRRVEHFETVRVAKDGRRLYASVSVSPIRDLEGRAIGLSEIVMDITQRRQVEQALRESEERFRSVAETATDAIVSADAHGRVTYFNPGAERLFGYAAREAIGKPLTLLMPERFVSAHHHGFQRFLETKQANVIGRTLELTARHQDGHEFPIELSLAHWEAGGALFFTAIIRDVTERKSFQQQLLQKQKFEVIGQLAAGVAHEINTPIQYVGSNASFLKHMFRNLDRLLEAYWQLLDAVKQGDVPPPLIAEVDRLIAEADIGYLRQEVPKAVEESLEGVERVAAIVRSMRELSHPGGGTKMPLDINQAIASTLTVCRNEWKYVAELVTDFDHELPLVPCLRDEFHQAILNIVLNAAQAITEIVGDGADRKGVITVRTRRDGDWATIRISDTGPGIPPSVQQKIFEPFFTTKQVGQGTGQGLAIARAVIVQKHGGTVTFETHAGAGTTFLIRLPLQPRDDGASARPQEVAHAERPVRR